MSLFGECDDCGETAQLRHKPDVPASEQSRPSVCSRCRGRRRERLAAERTPLPARYEPARLDRDYLMVDEAGSIQSSGRLSRFSDSLTKLRKTSVSPLIIGHSGTFPQLDRDEDDADDEDDEDALEAGTRVVYDRPEEPGRGEAIIQETGVDDWERWYLAEDAETGEEVQIGESSIITTAETGGPDR